MKLKPTSQILPLTSLRFFLATWVVVFHLYVILRGEANLAVSAIGPLSNIVFCAYVAVGDFFVLSGFILTLNYRPREPWPKLDCKQFALSRISRIYPVYLLGLLTISPLLIWLPLFSHAWPLLGRHLASGLLNVLMLQAWIPKTALTWNGPGWSISAEAFFYLVFPFLGRFFYSVATMRRALLLLTGLWIIQLLPAVVAVVFKVPGFGDLVAVQEPSAAFVAPLVCFNPLLSLPFFLSGIVLCRCFILLNDAKSFTGRGYLFYLPALTALLLGCALGNHIPYPLLHGGLLLPAELAMIIGLALGDRYLCRVLSGRWLVFMGKASYAEYVLHFPVRVAFEEIGAKWTPVNQINYLLVTCVVSALVYRFYETPLQDKFRAVLRNRTKSSNGLATSPIT